ncbi:MAG TPA: alpha/beta hydrolase [Dyella sp.]|uniref:alpha/beta fold hydrolase n=1 Tax=Dyella sp. TaxID=1869338 RepID=UPI002F93C619
MKRMKSLPCLIALAIAAAGAHADGDIKPSTRQEARSIIAESRQIVSPRGIDTLTKIPVNGTEQWLSIRGNDARNPILLFLHGGPASPDMPMAYSFQRPWEDYFTVVQWDQRGSGKTYLANDPKTIGPTLTIDQMTDDAEAVVSYLRKTYGKRKIFLLGHSWGTVLGVRLTQRHPDWFYAYIGVGQMVNTVKSEAIGYRFALDQAKAAHNDKAVEQLEKIAPYPAPDGTLERDKLNTTHQWLTYYGGLAYGRHDFGFGVDIEQLAPEYTDQDLDAIDKGSALTFQHLLVPLSRVDFTHDTHFGCPVLLFTGRHDYAVSHELTAQWFATLDAPSKRLVWFEDSSHMVMQEQPGRFLMHLVNDARPLAVQAGDAAPEETEQH